MISSVILGPLGFWSLSLPLFPALSYLLRSAYFRIKHSKVLCWPLWGQRVMTYGTKVCTDDLTPGERMKPFGSKWTSCQSEQLRLAFRFFWAVNLQTRQTHTKWITALHWALFSLLMFPCSECYWVFRWGVDAGVDHMLLYSHSPTAPPPPVPLTLAHSFIFHCCFLSQPQIYNRTRLAHSYVSYCQHIPLKDQSGLYISLQHSFDPTDRRHITMWFLLLKKAEWFAKIEANCSLSKDYN